MASSCKNDNETSGCITVSFFDKLSNSDFNEDMQVLRHSQLWYFRSRSSGLWRRVVFW